MSIKLSVQIVSLAVLLCICFLQAETIFQVGKNLLSMTTEIMLKETSYRATDIVLCSGDSFLFLFVAGNIQNNNEVHFQLREYQNIWFKYTYIIKLSNLYNFKWYTCN